MTRDIYVVSLSLEELEESNVINFRMCNNKFMNKITQTSLCTIWQVTENEYVTCVEFAFQQHFK